MSNSATITRLAANCPAWCDVDHDPERVEHGSYHHDGLAEIITLDPLSISRDETISVSVQPALFVEDGARCVEQIEVRTDDLTALELTVEDAARLAEALLAICARVRP